MGERAFPQRRISLPFGNSYYKRLSRRNWTFLSDTAVFCVLVPCTSVLLDLEPRMTCIKI